MGGRLDTEADAAIDATLDQLHEVVAARLGGHPVLAELVDEAEQVGQVSDLTRQQVQLALEAAALKDDARQDDTFARAVVDLVVRLRAAEQTSGPVAAGPGSAVFTGNVHVETRDGGTGIGQAANVYIGWEPSDPPKPGRPSR